MPTILRSGPYRLYFYSHEPNEPPHIHIDRDKLSAKYWLTPISLASNLGFSEKELRKILEIVEENQLMFVEAWNEYFGGTG